MHYIVQENVFRENNYNRVSEAIGRLGLPMTTVRIFPFVEKCVDVSDIPDGPFDVDELRDLRLPDGPVFAFGAVKLARIAARNGWSPGSMLNKNHDYEVYGDQYGSEMLNRDSTLHRLTDDLGWRPGESKFIRPTLDTKAFAGGLFNQAQWEAMLDAGLKSPSAVFNRATKIQVARPKSIQRECRFWVVGGKVVSWSQYRIGSRLATSPIVEPEAIRYAQRMVDLFSVADAFVIDTCLADDRWRIVECGCINSAGFYDADMQRVISALEEKFKHRIHATGR